MAGSSEASLGLYWWDGRHWQEEPASRLDLERNTFAAAPDHFSLWAMMVDDQRLYLPYILINR